MTESACLEAEDLLKYCNTALYEHPHACEKKKRPESLGFRRGVTDEELGQQRSYLPSLQSFRCCPS